MVSQRRKGSRKKRVLRVLAGLLVLLAIAAGAGGYLAFRAEPILRAQIVAALQERFHAKVELDSFHLSFTDGLSVEGRGLRIWPPAQVAGINVPAPVGNVASKPSPGHSSASASSKDSTTNAGSMLLPLVRLEEFHFHAPLRYRPGKPLHIALVQLRGLEITLPPKSHFTYLAAPAIHPAELAAFEIDAIECATAHLTMETDKPGKQPLEFPIRSLKLTNISAKGTMHFAADLTNPRPQGHLLVTGSFGPWLTLDPGESPLAGDYKLDHADLGSFKEIGGTLNSTGRFQGNLRDLEVRGKAETPDFRLTEFDNPLPLRTFFQAAVDGTNGDTRLESVDATLGHSHFTAKGTILRVPAPGGSKDSLGHDIALAVVVDKARIEDFLLLAGHSTTPMLTGALALKSTLHIPPGSAPVHKRLQLDGAFQLNQVRFTNPKIQDRVAELSKRGLGNPASAPDPATALSHMQGDFHLLNSQLHLPALEYDVPGAKIQLKGSYALDGGALDFAGTAQLQASVSQIVGGWKGALLKPFDGLFRKNGAGAQIPIHITGTREKPEFGISVAGKEFSFPAGAKKNY